MSRIGKNPVSLPPRVEVSLEGQTVTVKGPKGTLSERLPEAVRVQVEGSSVQVARVDDSRVARSAHGLSRTLVANMVAGVTDGYKRKLMITGVGYRAELRANRWIQFSLGYSHPILFELPEGVSAVVEAKENSVTLEGFDKQLVGATAARIRGLRPPEPYKGKGVRYADEVIRRKEGKTGGKGGKGGKK
jgi:large subunit ribosomal protein L6